MEDLLVHGQSVVWWVLSALGMVLSRFVWVKLKNEWARAFLGRVYAEIDDAVKEVYQVYVDAIRARSADGKLTDAEKSEAKAMAIESAKSNLGPKGIKRLLKVLGLNTGALDNWLGTKVEASVRNAKIPF
jgi:hypothetical protein